MVPRYKVQHIGGNNWKAIGLVREIKTRKGQSVQMGELNVSVNQ